MGRQTPSCLCPEMMYEMTEHSRGKLREFLCYNDGIENKGREDTDNEQQ